MASESAALYIDLKATIDQSMKKVSELINDLNNKIDQTGKSSHGTGQKTKSMFGEFFKASVATQLFNQASAALFELGKTAITTAGQFERYKTQLTVMLGSTEAAIKRLDELKKFAAKTPFQLSEVVEAANKLQTLKRYSEETMTDLGDLAAASGKPFEQVLNAYGKLVSGQKGMAVDMFRDLLISAEDWQKATGKSISKNGELLASTEEMVKAIPKIIRDKNFSGMMAEQSKTFEGVLSNFQDSVTNLQGDLGTAFLPVAKSVLSDLTNFISEIQEKIDFKELAQNVSGGFEVAKVVFDEFEKTLTPIVDGILTDLKNAMSDLTGETDMTTIGFFALASIVELIKSGMTVARVNIKGVIDIGKNFIETWQMVFDFVVSGWKLVSNAVKGFFNILKAVNDYKKILVEGFSGTIKIILQKFLELGDETGKIIEGMLTLNPNKIKKGVEGIKTLFKTSFKDIGKEIDDTFSELDKQSEEIYGSVKNTTEQLGDDLKDFTEKGKKVVTQYIDYLGTIKDSIANSIKAALTELKGFTGDVEETTKKLMEALEAGRKKALEEEVKNNKDKSDQLKKIEGDQQNILAEKYKEYLKIKSQLDNGYNGKYNEWVDLKNKLEEYNQDKNLKAYADYVQQKYKIASVMMDILSTSVTTDLEGLEGFIGQTFQGITEGLSSIFKALEEGKGPLDIVKIGFEAAGQVLSSVISGITSLFTEDFKKKLNEVDAEYKKTLDDIEKAKDEAANKENEAYQQSIKDHNDALMEKLLNEQKFKEAKDRLSEKELVDEYNRLKYSGDNELAEAQRIADALNQMDADRLALRDEAASLDEENKQSESEAFLEAYQEQIKSLNDEDLSRITAIREAEMESQSQADKEKKKLEAQKLKEDTQKNLAELTAKQKHEDNLKTIEAKAAAEKENAERIRREKQIEIERNQFNAKKVNEIADIWIRAAAGIASAVIAGVQAFGGIPMVGPALAAAAGATMSAVIGTTAGIQTGIIATKEYVPPAFIFGGDPVNGKYFLAGEEGPELVRVPLSTGRSRVYRNSDTQEILSQNNTPKSIRIENNLYVEKKQIAQIVREVLLEDQDFAESYQ